VSCSEGGLGNGGWCAATALYRPQTGYYVDLAAMAAALFESLIMNHPFGNKRVAFFATDVFLRLNGWRVAVDPGETHRWLIRLLEDGRCDFHHLEPWIRPTAVPHQP
jgi:death-on-curing protein